MIEDKDERQPLKKPYKQIHGWYVVGDWLGCNFYLHKNGKVEDGIGALTDIDNGWFETEEEANEAIKKYNEQYKENK